MFLWLLIEYLMFDLFPDDTGFPMRLGPTSKCHNRINL